MARSKGDSKLKKSRIQRIKELLRKYGPLTITELCNYIGVDRHVMYGYLNTRGDIWRTRRNNQWCWRLTEQKEWVR